VEKSIYVFMGESAQFPSGAFMSFDLAKEWIEKYTLSGVLTKMPIDIGIYDWAISMEYFEPKREYQKEGKFIQKFTSASLEHWHFENGKMM
jgi:hypothetical protein